jgi:Domain of unknown function (DUF4956)
MTRPALFAIDLVAVCVLVFGLYFPRHRRRDLVVAYLGVNVGVLAVAGSLTSSNVGAGLGLVNETTVVEVRYSHRAGVGAQRLAKAGLSR